MAESTDNIEAVVRAVCAKTLEQDGKSEAQLRADVEIYWHVVAAYLEVGATRVATPPGHEAEYGNSSEIDDKRSRRGLED